MRPTSWISPSARRRRPPRARHPVQLAVVALAQARVKAHGDAGVTERYLGGLDRTAEVGERLLGAVEADPTLELVVDVDRRTLSAPAIGLDVDFPLEASVRERFLEGLDDIGITLRTEEAITHFEETRPAWLPSA